MLAAINDASGYVESYLVASERYLPDDLQAIISQGGMSGDFLKRIISNIAFYFMFGGRDAPNPPETVTTDYNMAMKDLESLGNGSLVLSFQQAEAAGVASNFNMTQSQILALNQFTDRCQRVMGIRNYLRRGF
jgi:phage gp36-like protein